MNVVLIYFGVSLSSCGTWMSFLPISETSTGTAENMIASIELGMSEDHRLMCWLTVAYL